MPTPSPHFSKDMPTFFRALEKNNDRAWFTPRKPIFESKIRTPMIELVTLLNNSLRKISPDHVADDPARLLYRIYRDTRFSKDKTPYKTHLGATFPHRILSRHGGAGFYFEISHKHVGIAGGVYMPGPDELLALRTAITKNPKDFLKIIHNPKLKSLDTLQGEQLKRLPKPWLEHANSPIADFLKFKQFYWYVELPAALALTPRLAPTLAQHFQLLAPALAWFNQSILKHRPQPKTPAESLRPDPMW